MRGSGFDLDPTSLDTARPAAVALARLYQQAEQWRDLIDVLRRQAEWSYGSDRKTLLFRIGEIQQNLLVDSDAAIATYREILDSDAQEVRALDALEALHVAKEQWTDLNGILRRRVDLAQDSQTRRDLLWRIAEVIEVALRPRRGDYRLRSHPERARRRRSDDRCPGAPGQTAEQHSNLLDMLERRLPLTRDVSDRVTLRLKMAALLEGALRRNDAALESYREVLVDDAHNQVAREGLERMLDDDSLRLRAAEVLEPIYTLRNDTRALERVSELFATYLADVHERIGRLRKVAELRIALGEQKGALEALSRAVRLAVTEGELPDLLDLVEAHVEKYKTQRDEIELYREVADQILDTRVQERVLLQIAKRKRMRLAIAMSRGITRRVLDNTNDHLIALEALEKSTPRVAAGVAAGNLLATGEPGAA